MHALRRNPTQQVHGVNRTDRLYAIVEELRARAPRPMSARQLSEIYEVSRRTIERDMLALQEAGVPIWGTEGRRGGYTIDPARTLPPINFTPSEAVAVAVALANDTGPFTAAGRTARHKLVAAMGAEAQQATFELTRRVRHVQPPVDAGEMAPVAPNVQRAIGEHLVARIDYVAADRATTQRVVEPIGLVAHDGLWYLVAWCRLREDVRNFRLDRITGCQLTGERAPSRDPDRFLGGLPTLASLPEPSE